MKLAPIRLAAVIVASIMFPKTVLAQGSGSASTQPSPKSEKPQSIHDRVSDLEKEVEKLKVKCDRCKGSGKEPDLLRERTLRDKCLDCDGDRRILPPQELLEMYLRYCEFTTTHAKDLSELKNKADANRIAKRKATWLERIREKVGTGTTYAPRKWRPGEDLPPAIPTGQYERPLTKLGRGLILSKSNPVGHAIAFTGEVAGTSEANGSVLALVAVENAEDPDLHCYVVKPAVARWVQGAKLCVIGRIVDSSSHKNVLLDESNAVVVHPVEGTE